MDKGEIYNYLWSLGILEAKQTGWVGPGGPRRDEIIDSVRGGLRLEGLFSDEEWIILRGMIISMDRNIKLNNLLTE
jgi:hypothetical protein